MRLDSVVLGAAFAAALVSTTAVLVDGACDDAAALDCGVEEVVEELPGQGSAGPVQWYADAARASRP